jgi:hypothetical protein
MRKIAFVLAGMLAFAVVVVPAQAAKPPPKCVAHSVSYEVSGMLTATGSLTKNSDGSYNGTLTVKVTRTNHNAGADKGMTTTYTLTNAHVSFGHGVSKTAPAAGSRADLKGTITTEPKTCTGFTPTVTIKKVELLAAKKK